MIPSINGVYYQKGFWYVNAYLHCDMYCFKKAGGSDIWYEYDDDTHEWHVTDEIFSDDCNNILREFIVNTGKICT